MQINGHRGAGNRGSQVSVTCVATVKPRGVEVWWALLVLLALAAWVLLAGAPARGQTEGLYLLGNIWNTYTTSPIAGATVKELDSGLSVLTNPSGDFTIGPFSYLGWRMYRVEAAGYLPMEVGWSFEAPPPGALNNEMELSLLAEGTEENPHYWRGFPHEWTVPDPLSMAVAADGTTYFLIYPNDTHALMTVLACTSTGDLLRSWTCGRYTGVVVEGRPDIAVAGDGTVVVSVPRSGVVQRFSPEGALLNTITMSADTAPEQLAVEGSRLYVTLQAPDTMHYHLAAYDLSGTFIGEWDLPVAGDNTPLVAPRDMAVASDHTVYMLNGQTGQDRIWHFGATGATLGHWGGSTVLDAQFFAIGYADRIYLSGSSGVGAPTVHVYTPDGTAVATWWNGGRAPGQLDMAGAIAVDGARTVYIQDRGNGGVHCFSADGVFQRRWGSGGSGIDEFGTNYRQADTISFDVAAAPDGSIWVTDPGNRRIKHLSVDGVTLKTVGTESGTDGNFMAPGPMTIITGPVVETPDPKDYRVYVSSYLNTVQVFDAEGNYLSRFLIGTDPFGGDRRPGTDMTADVVGNIMVLEGTNTVSTYRPDGVRISSWQANYNGAPIAGITHTPISEVVLWFNTDTDCIEQRYTDTGQLLSAGAYRDTPSTHYRVVEVVVVPRDTTYVLLESEAGQYLLHLTPAGTANLPMDDDIHTTTWEPAALAAAPTGVLWVSDRTGHRLFGYYYGRFRDVAWWFWAYQQIQDMVGAEVVKGFPDGTYRPGDAVTRGQMAIYIARAMAGGDAFVPTGPATPTFSDVPPEAQPYKYVEYAVAHGVVKGYKDGTYLPTKDVDRGQMAAFVARAVAGGEDNVPDNGCTVLPVFPDVPCDFWSRKHIEYIKERSITVGYPDGKYHPEYTVTRDQMAVYIRRAYDYM